MKENIGPVKEYYDQNTEHEWERFDRHPYEFELTKRMLDRYIKPGDRVLDIGGGPGRYSIYFAQKGCDVTLLDLSENNAAFAKNKAAEAGVKITAYSGNALDADKIIGGTFDHVLLMGPMYHLLEEEDRVCAVNSALKLLKTGGIFSVSFISLFAGVIYCMVRGTPDLMFDDREREYLKKVLSNESYSGDAFTKAHFSAQKDILTFLGQFPLEKLHFFGQESILIPCEEHLKEQSREVQAAWLDLAESLCERKELLSYSEHLMYIGKRFE